ncbi:MAG: hypothetical protein KBS86_00805 [Proteobacteria bacterium]|nr:hypothetical protein [Candidatus Enterousia scatequi]
MSYIKGNLQELRDYLQDTLNNNPEMGVAKIDIQCRLHNINLMLKGINRVEALIGKLGRGYKNKVK